MKASNYFAITGLFLFAACASTQTGNNATPSTPALGEEYSSVPENEARLAPVISQMFQGIVKAGYETRKNTADQRPARRDAHAKHHGCVAAQFTVEKNLPADWKVSLFGTPASYKAIIRFSNGDFTPKDDRLGDAHGMAVKVLGVSGEKLLNSGDANGETDTQDFVMIDNRVFFMRKPETYVPFVQAELKGPEGIKEWAAQNPYEFALIQGTVHKKPDSPLGVQYWSQTPYKLGSKAMKFTARPCAGSKASSIPLKQRHENYLKDTLKKNLASKAACFDFYLNLQTDAVKTPVEDPTIEWPETVDGKSTLIKVATINIPVSKNATSDASMRLCEDLSFSPWHGLTTLQPLGGVNRIRKLVYIEASKLRHSLNQAPFPAVGEAEWNKLLSGK